MRYEWLSPTDFAKWTASMTLLACGTVMYLVPPGRYRAPRLRLAESGRAV